MNKASRSREYYNRIRRNRTKWKESVPQKCMWCSKPDTYYPLEIHEIERRSQAYGRWGVLCNYLLLCRNCHSGIFDSMKHAKQLSVKMIKDPVNFNLEDWLTIKDPELNAPKRVTLEDIVQFLEMR